MNDQTNELKSIRLIRKIGRRVERGHLWVFSNEVEEMQGNPQPGDEVAIFGGKNQFLGMGLFSPSSLIRARIYSRTRGEKCDGDFIIKKMQMALAYRRQVMGDPHSFRLLHSEADALPGLIIDVFGDHVVFQISTAGMEARRDAIISAIDSLLNPKAIIDRSDIPHRRAENLAETKGIVKGEPASPCPIRENGVTILADLLNGQKTGYFLDQVHNRTLAAPFFRDKRVFDLFCYLGSWSLVAAANGAKECLALDTSQTALDLAAQSAAANNFSNQTIRFQNADVFTYLRNAVSQKEKFDVIILDPPALAKSRKDFDNALRAYRELNIQTMRLLAPEGLLITCSCSHCILPDDFQEMLTMAAKDTRSDFSILHQSGQGPDHPIHLQTPETAYLKTVFLRKRGF